MTVNPALAERLLGYEPRPNSRVSKLMRKDGVRDSPELRRILSLPKREPVFPADTSELSGLLATTEGEWSLKGVQAFALEECYRVGGLVASIRVGGGKTLITFLLARTCEALRPLLLIPAELVEKTRRDFRMLAAHFHVPAELVPVVMSYELLGREQSAAELERINPDLIMADEGHRLKNPKAAVTRRVKRHLDAHPSCRFAVLSGSLTTRALAECAHLYDWALRERSPLPRRFVEVVEWGLAIDENLANPLARLEAGGLAKFMDADDRRVHRDDPISAVRQAVRKRIHATAGVVATTDDGPPMPIVIRLRAVEGYSKAIDDAFVKLESEWATPGGETFSDAVTKWRHETELAAGFYCRWKVEPPLAWKEARRTWFSIVRHIIDHNRRELDSPAQVENAVRRGEYAGATANENGIAIGGCTIDEALAKWDSVRDTYEPETVPVWLDDRLVREVRAWLDEAPGLVWVSHIALGEKLAKDLRVPYYRAGGLDAQGRLIDNAKPGSSAIASIHSCRTGRNLQGIWSRNLYAISTIGAEAWEQSLGRTHRDGQRADEVTADVLVGCAAQVRGFDTALGQAKYAHDVTGQPQKLQLADIVRPMVWPSGPRWIGL